MFKHHKESIQIMTDYFKEMPGVIALILGGSVAKGNERPDSDLDGMVILHEEAFAAKEAANTTAETIGGRCTYEGGYFDIKYMTKKYLEDAAAKASEPTRNSFLGSRVLFSADGEIPELVSRIPVFQEQEYEEKMLSFYADLSLNYHYFWQCCGPEGYMRLRTAGEILYCIYRMILQENRILFPCSRRLEEFVAKAPLKPDKIMELSRDFIVRLDEKSCGALVETFLSWCPYQPPEDYNQLMSRYIADFEQWWRIPRPLISEW